MSNSSSDRLKKVADELFDGNQSEMARMMDMTPQAMNKYFQGDREPGIKILKRLVSIGINVNWVISGIPPMKISDISEAGVVSFTFEDQEDWKGKGVEEIAKSAPKALNLSRLTPEIYNNPLKMLHLMVQDMFVAWEAEGHYLSKKDQKEKLLEFMDIIAQQTSNAKRRIEDQ